MKLTTEDILLKKAKDLTRDEVLYLIGDIGVVDIAKCYNMPLASFNDIINGVLDKFDPKPVVHLKESDIPNHVTNGAWMNSAERKYYLVNDLGFKLRDY